MSEDWKYQIRIYLPGELAQLARRDPGDPALGPLTGILSKHHATIKCQLDAFSDYVAEAERHGTENYPLYAWTKATIENPAKQAKYVQSFTVYVTGDEVYPRDIADALEADLLPLVERALISRVSKHDTNPANNPQPPKRFRQQ
jgi:hypothetical protein